MGKLVKLKRKGKVSQCIRMEEYMKDIILIIKRMDWGVKCTVMEICILVTLIGIKNMVKEHSTG